MSEKIFTGTITEIIDPVLYQIKVNIPGIATDILAFPMRGEVDEPRVGDFVLLRSLDPIFNSYFLYQRLKENDHIGFRSNGKMVDITPDYITIGIFDPSIEYNDVSQEGKYRPEVTDWIKLDKDGNLDINLRTNSTIKILGDSGIEISGKSDIKVTGDSNVILEANSKVEVSGKSDIKVTGDSNVVLEANSKVDISGNSEIKVGGNCDLDVSGNTTVKSPNITVNGSNVTVTGGTLIVKGNSSTDMSGPFNCLKNCVFSGVPHSGSTVSGT